MAADRQHFLQMPDRTGCGRVGNLIELGLGKAIHHADRLFRITADPDAVDCARCRRMMRRHGLAFGWVDVPPHEASVAVTKRRRHRRRSSRAD